MILVLVFLITPSRHFGGIVVSVSVSSAEDRCFDLVKPNTTQLVISHACGKDRQVVTTSGTYPWSFVRQI